MSPLDDASQLYHVEQYMVRIDYPSRSELRCPCGEKLIWQPHVSPVGTRWTFLQAHQLHVRRFQLL